MDNSEETFPAANADGELHPGHNKSVEVDPVSAEVADKKERSEAAAIEKEKEKERKDAMETLKYTIIVSGITVALVGAVYAIVVKLKEK